MQSFFLGGGVKFFLQKEDIEVKYKIHKLSWNRKKHVRKLILSKGSKIFGLFIKIIFEIFPLKVGYMYFIMNFLISGYLYFYRSVL